MAAPGVGGLLLNMHGNYVRTRDGKWVTGKLSSTTVSFTRTKVRYERGCYGFEVLELRCVILR
jgi:hypothetical protein